MADFEEIYAQHYGFIQKYLLSLCRSPDIAEELTQETFFRAYINFQQLRAPHKAAAWLCQIARNLFFAWYRERKRFAPLEEQSELAANYDMANAAQVRMLSAQAAACLAKLDSPYREVFSLHVLGEVSLVDISQLYGKSESWARVTFFRAKQKLMERMHTYEL